MVVRPVIRKQTTKVREEGTNAQLVSLPLVKAASVKQLVHRDRQQKYFLELSIGRYKYVQCCVESTVVLNID